MRWFPWVVTLVGCTSADGGAVDAIEGIDAAADAVDASAAEPCAERPGLVWHRGRKTTYTSYPEPGSEECVDYSGCDYQGLFAACTRTMPETWVAAHDLVALFPLGELALHDLCLRSGDRSMRVTVVDTCADTDCDGCCSENRGDADALVDIESYTNARWGLDDGPLEWADLGPHPDPGFDGCR